ncbi:hypothetical protein CRUP_013458, partial [Coryphaenoides rupestris]
PPPPPPPTTNPEKNAEKTRKLKRKNVESFGIHSAEFTVHVTQDGASVRTSRDFQGHRDTQLNESGTVHQSGTLSVDTRPVNTTSRASRDFQGHQTLK